MQPSRKSLRIMCHTVFREFLEDDVTRPRCERYCKENMRWSYCVIQCTVSGQSINDWYLNVGDWVDGNRCKTECRCDVIASLMRIRDSFESSRGRRERQTINHERVA